MSDPSNCAAASGDGAAQRNGFDLSDVARVHSVTMWITLAVTVWLAYAARRVPRIQRAALLLARFTRWKPGLAMTRIDLAVMFLGYLAIVAQLLVEAAGLLGAGAWVGSVSVHLFTVGVMGLIIPAMFVRISKGHTGRKVAFDAGDKLLIWIMLAGLVVRVVLPQLAPGAYMAWVHLAATCWFLCFAILGGRMLPRLLSPRSDGKEH